MIPIVVHLGVGEYAHQQVRDERDQPKSAIQRPPAFTTILWMPCAGDHTFGVVIEKPDSFYTISDIRSKVVFGNRQG